jgi:amino acid adenylation domain-containing protein
MLTPNPVLAATRAQAITGPVSYSQERMWLAEQLVDGEPAYNLQLGLRLRGHLDAGALQQALDFLARRHESLRTSFILGEAGLTSVVRPAGAVLVGTADVSGVADPAAAVAARAQAELGGSFTPAEGDTFRVLLLRAGPADHTLLITLDHLIADAWSVRVLHEDLVAAYARYARGDDTEPAPVPVAYREFAAWQRDWQDGPEARAELAYWRDHLPARPPRLSLPVRPGGQRTREMQRYSSLLDDGLAAEATRTARRARSAPFMVLFAAYAALLGGYGQHDDVLIGTLCHGRTRPDLEEVVGFFVNAVALRADLSGGPSLRALLARVREVVLDAYAHQEVPFDHVVEAVRPERPAGARPFFDAIFQLADVERVPAELPGLLLEPLPAASRVAGADVVLTIAREHDGYRCHWDFDAGLLAPATVARMHEHYTRLLAQALAEPDRPLGEFDLLGAGERALTSSFIRPALAAGSGWTLPGAFEAMAAALPGQPALSGAAPELTYAQLNAQCNRLAHALRRRGIGPEQAVGLFLDDHADVLIAALGVLKAGGAYLPLDPGYPADRISYMLSDAAPACVITRAHLAGNLPLGGPRELILEHLDGELAGQPDTDPERVLHSDNLAYVIYTSGSTGRPKGVGVRHHGLAIVTAAQREALGLGPSDRVLQMASPNFDMSVLEVLMAFSAGATVCVAPGAAAAHADLDEVLRVTRPTAVLLPPSALAGLSEDGPAADLRTVTVGGEACPVPLAAAWGRGRRFFNLYGPTEASIVSTAYQAGTADAGSGILSIGALLPGVTAYVVQPGGSLAPVSVPGELHIGGEVLARGYLGRPGLTAERFIPDRFSGVPGARLYRTGDLVRWRDDGRLEFLGRIDHQVKIRGYRIELGEIESCLAAHPAVAEAVVTAADEVLHAYVAAGPQAAGLTAAELRGHCAATLPAYMVPARFLVLDRLPALPSGKVDRASLPAIDAGGDEPRVAPRTDRERACAAIWADVLGVLAIGALDDFFDRGGHSLAATRVIGRVRREFGVRLPVRTLFDHPVLADFAAALAGWEASHG